MRISFFGSSLVSAYWNGAATYYRGIIKALAARGHSVTFFEPNAFDRQKNRDMDDPAWATVVVYEPTLAELDRVLEQAIASDLVIKCSGVGVFDELLEERVLQLQTPYRQVFFWDVDAPATLDRLAGNDADPFHSLVPRYDAVLTFGGGLPVINAYKKVGARHCLPIYNALDPSTHHPVKSDERFAADLSFLGNRLPDRESRAEDFFLRPAASLPAHRFLLGGSGWGDKPMSANVNYIGHVGTGQHNALNCSAKAVLNISRESTAAYGYSPATRVFEAAGAAACIITDYWQGIEFFFEPGREVLVAESGLEVAELVAGLDPETAVAIGQAAYRRVLKDHTYDQRAQLFDDFMALLAGKDIAATAATRP